MLKMTIINVSKAFKSWIYGMGLSRPHSERKTLKLPAICKHRKHVTLTARGTPPSFGIYGFIS